MPTGANRYPEVAAENKRKYLKAPSPAEIRAFLDELGITITQFENFYGMYKGDLGKVLRGVTRCNAVVQLAPSYWHIIYEKIVPTYGLAYTAEQKKKVEKKKEREVKFKPQELTDEDRLRLKLK